MALILIGVVLLLLKLGGWYQFSQSEFWSWVVVLVPFGLASVWWAWSDWSGRTQRKAMEAMDTRKKARRQQQLEALGRVEKKKR